MFLVCGTIFYSSFVSFLNELWFVKQDKMEREASQNKAEVRRRVAKPC